MRTRLSLVAAFDLLCCLLLVFVILALVSSQKPPHIPTFGQFAVTATWKQGSNDDVDLYVRDPDGNIAYFANPNAGLMNLEHDDLGTGVSGTQVLADGRKVRVLYNGERVVLRGYAPGEYTVNVHLYSKNDPGPIAVTVTLWSLRGQDKSLEQRTVTLHAEGDERTAFRVTLDAAGNVVAVSHVQSDLVGQSVRTGQAQSPGDGGVQPNTPGGFTG